MKECFLIAEITFAEAAKIMFNFPITNSIRVSIWFEAIGPSTFSEITEIDHPIEVLKPYKVKIRLVERGFLQSKLKKGVEFKMGVFPIAIAHGKIISIEDV